MTVRSRRQPPWRAAPLLAGWLFADLFLGLTVIGLGSQRGEAPPAPKPVVTTTTTTVVETTTTTAPPPSGLDRNPSLLVLAPGAAGIPCPEFAGQVQRDLGPRGASRAGVVIAEGVSDSLVRGQQYAADVSAHLRDCLPATFGASDGFADVVYKTYRFAGGGEGEVRLEVYFLNEA